MPVSKTYTPFIDKSINFEADNIFLDLNSDLSTSLEGNVLIKDSKNITSANRANYDPSSESLNLDGEVNFSNDNLSIISQSALFSYSNGEIIFDEAQFIFDNNTARGNAELIEIQDKGILNLINVNYTTCPVGSNDWILEAQNIILNTDTGSAKAEKVVLSFKDIPIVYLPKISFPLDNNRKTGFLAPEIGGGGRSGNEIRLPWYWNIAKNYDATITPRILTGRGFQLGNEFRYLTNTSKGSMQIDYLANDNIFGESIYLVALDNETNFSNGLRAKVDFGNTSDGNYFEDLGGNLSMTSITHLNQELSFDAYGQYWSFLSRFQNYQTIDKSLSLNERPYHRLPQIKFSALLPYNPFGVSARIDNEFVYFDREVGTTGWRIDTEPQIEWSIKNDGWYINPKLSLKHTQYELKNLTTNKISDPSRTLPIASLDAGLFFDRKLGDSNNFTQTFEPRLLYLNVPYRDQDDLPVFDTIEPDLNLVQLFQKNRFLGIDRIADTEQISLGFSSNIINNSNGKQIVSATLGKSFYMKDQKVNLPNNNLIMNSTSDFIAELRFLIFDDLNFNFSHQWNNGDSGVTSSHARIQYRPGNNKILNFGYRFREDLLEQGNISWSWPVTQTWNFLGHVNYSVRDKKTLEQFYGLEYESCCWGIRMIYREYVSTRDGQEDTSFGIQLVLKGMTSIGTKANKLLERGILGYSNYIQ
ncbi:MAG: LPS assembly protein LptD [Woeseiaceae bacterium]|nr:LPS assembly protein LptD [Woeseiaceae bacterium]